MIFSHFERLNENHRKSSKINENQRKSTKIYENLRKSTKIDENQHLFDIFRHLFGDFRAKIKIL